MRKEDIKKVTDLTPAIWIDDAGVVVSMVDPVSMFRTMKKTRSTFGGAPLVHETGCDCEYCFWGTKLS